MRHLCASAVVVVLVLGMLGPPLSVGQMTAASSPGTAQYGACGWGWERTAFSLSWR